MVNVSASVNLPWHHKVQKFSSGTGSPRWSQKKRAIKQLWWWCYMIFLADKNSSILAKADFCGFGDELAAD